MADRLGPETLPRRIRSASTGGAMPASLPLDDSARFVSDDTRWLFEMGRRTQKVSRAKGRGDCPGSRLSGKLDSAGAKSQFEEEFSGSPGEPDFGRRALPCVSRTRICRARRQNARRKDDRHSPKDLEENVAGGSGRSAEIILQSRRKVVVGTRAEIGNHSMFRSEARRV